MVDEIFDKFEEIENTLLSMFGRTLTAIIMASTFTSGLVAVGVIGIATLNFMLSLDKWTCTAVWFIIGVAGMSVFIWFQLPSRKEKDKNE